ncbi:hypothetical protein SAY87_011284 [Trapa incisa]|uniref:Uncharacterized protein n=1 Tax=Trapa incisa TaxID=236973 RepID=A0AAN7GYE1_9MYRT|nr:hypothetical protein SAY87_011284 [Trapa incisa]
MEEDFRQYILPHAEDLGEACGWELNHVAMSEESGVTAYSSSSTSHSSMAWTDKKHNLYLDSLERSFVDQLNHSRRTHALTREITKAPSLSAETPVENCASFHEENMGVHATACQTFSFGLMATSMQQSAHYICYQNPVGSTAEVTDQNFVEEDGKRSTNSPTAKRDSRSSAEGSSKDQVTKSFHF